MQELVIFKCGEGILLENNQYLYIHGYRLCVRVVEEFGVEISLFLEARLVQNKNYMFSQ